MPFGEAAAGSGKKLVTLKRQGDFKAVFDEGHSAANKEMAVYFRENGLGRFRFGFSISKKVGKAVVRNRIRRKLKEIIRKEIKNHFRESVPGKLFFKPQNDAAGADIIIIARKSAAEASYQVMEAGLASLIEKCAKKRRSSRKGKVK